MSDNPAVAASPAAPGTEPADNLAARLIGVVFSPYETFTRIAARPRWIGALLVVTLVVVTATMVFFRTDVGQTALLDQQVRQMENFGMQVSGEQYDQMESGIGLAAMITGLAPIVSIPIVTLVVAGILYAVFNALLGGSATFAQVAAIVTHSGAISILQHVFVMPLNYARGSLAGATNLGIFVPFLDEGNLIARFLGAIDLFIIWWLVVLSIGLGVLYRRRTTPIFWSFMGIYVVIALVIALVMRASGGA